jgi:small subunit ribosomal protein S2
MAEEQQQQTVAPKIEDLYPDPAFKEMVDAGVFFGRKKTRTNPRMKPYILTNRNGIEIVNLGRTVGELERAMDFVRDRIAENALVLFVATQPPARGAVELAKEFGCPVVSSRWLGGTLTNFRIIGKRIEHFKKLKSEWGTSVFDKYTKKERLMIEKELARLTELFAGLENLTDLPKAAVIIDPNLHLTAVREARILGIPVVAFANTDSDPALLEYPVVGNNKASVSINWFLTKLRAAMEDGKKLGVQRAAEAEAARKAQEAAAAAVAK